MLKFGFMDTEEEHNEDRQENPTKNSGKHLSFFLSFFDSFSALWVVKILLRALKWRFWRRVVPRVYDVCCGLDLILAYHK